MMKVEDIKPGDYVRVRAVGDDYDNLVVKIICTDYWPMRGELRPMGYRGDTPIRVELPSRQITTFPSDHLEELPLLDHLAAAGIS